MATERNYAVVFIPKGSKVIRVRAVSAKQALVDAQEEVAVADACDELYWEAVKVIDLEDEYEEYNVRDV